jgi:hypothetical protein
LPKRQSARLGAACLVAADALAGAEIRRGVPRDVDPEGASWDALDAKVVAAQGAAWREQLALQGQRDVPRLALRAQS